MGKELLMLRNSIKGQAGKIAQETARKYLEKSCESGHIASFLYLGMAFELGVGGPVDLEKAKVNYEQAMEKGDPQAYFRLAIMSQENGEPDKYYLLMKSAAERGLLEAQHNLGCFYLEKNEITKAMGWFIHAGKFDFYPSMINIGSIFLNGRDPILTNPMAAFIWLKRAQHIENSEKLQEMVDHAQVLINNLSKNGA